MITLLLLCFYSAAAAETVLIDHKLSIERIVNFDIHRKILTLVIDLEQGIFGERIQDDHLSYIPKDNNNGYFNQISILGDLKQISDKTEAAVRYDNEEVVAVRRRFQVEFPCDSKFGFPFDTYECKLRIVSERPKDEFDIRWATRNIGSPSEVDNFKVLTTELSTCRYQRSVPSAESATSTNGLKTCFGLELHGCLQIAISLERPLVVAIFRYFAPTTIILMLSWLCFYQRRDKSNIRLIVFCACAIIETIIVLNYLNSCPATTTLTPADIWALVLCINSAMVVLLLFLIALAEARAVKYRNLIADPTVIRKESMARYQKHANKHLLYDKNMEQSQCSSYDGVVNTVFKKRADSAALTSVRLQIAARILCPIVFLISVVLYFSLSVVSNK